MWQDVVLTAVLGEAAERSLVAFFGLVNRGQHLLWNSHAWLTIVLHN